VREWRFLSSRESGSRVVRRGLPGKNASIAIGKEKMQRGDIKKGSACVYWNLVNV